VFGSSQRKDAGAIMNHDRMEDGLNATRWTRRHGTRVQSNIVEAAGKPYMTKALASMVTSWFLTRHLANVSRRLVQRWLCTLTAPCSMSFG